MEFITWPNADEATQAEDWLVSEIIHAFTLPPTSRLHHIQDVFKKMQASLGIESKSSEVITNINPYKCLNERGKQKIVLSLMAMNLPFSSEGILIREEDKGQKKSGQGRRFTMPGLYQSIIHHGPSSPIFAIPTAREMNNTIKGYDHDLPFSGPLSVNDQTRKVIDVLASEQMDYGNMWAWIDRAVRTEHVAHAAAEQSGLMNIFLPSFDNAGEPTGQNKSNLDNDNDKHGQEHLIRLVDIFAHKDTRHRSFNYLFVYASKELGQLNPDKITFERAVDKISTASELIAALEPKKAKFIMGCLVTTALSMNYGIDGNDLMRDALKDKLDQKILKNQCNAKMASLIATELSMPSLLSKASDNARASVLMDSFDI